MWINGRRLEQKVETVDAGGSSGGVGSGRSIASVVLVETKAKATTIHSGDVSATFPGA